MPNFVSQVRHLFLAGVPDPFFGINRVKSAIGLVIKLDVVEDEKLRFRPKHRRVSDPGAGQIFLCALGNSSGITDVRLASAGLGNGASQ